MQKKQTGQDKRREREREREGERERERVRKNQTNKQQARVGPLTSNIRARADSSRPEPSAAHARSNRRHRTENRRIQDEQSVAAYACHAPAAVTHRRPQHSKPTLKRRFHPPSPITPITPSSESSLQARVRVVVAHVTTMKLGQFRHRTPAPRSGTSLEASIYNTHAESTSSHSRRFKLRKTPTFTTSGGRRQ